MISLFISHPSPSLVSTEPSLLLGRGYGSPTKMTSMIPIHYMRFVHTQKSPTLPTPWRSAVVKVCAKGTALPCWGCWGWNCELTGLEQALLLSAGNTKLVASRGICWEAECPKQVALCHLCHCLCADMAHEWWGTGSRAQLTLRTGSLLCLVVWTAFVSHFADVRQHLQKPNSFLL